jgi:SAM-dependent methyltransferase
VSEPAALPREWFARIDPSPDALFYAAPRLVNHVDDATIAALTDYYREVLPPGAEILDLMSSWVSHLPADVSFRRVAGLGMNRDELAANPRLSDFCVHDLNARPELPYPAESFDAVVNAVSIQYLIHPVAVLAEVARVLRPGGISIVAMSHRCFPTKAVRAFQVLPRDGRFELVTTYHALAGGFAAAACLDRSPQAGGRGSQDREAAAQRGEAERGVGSREGWKTSEHDRTGADPLWIVAARRLG